MDNRFVGNQDTHEEARSIQQAETASVSFKAQPRVSLLDELFSYHSPRPEQMVHYQAIRSAGKYFAEVMLNNTPAGADQSAALRKIREAVMTANAAIALNGRA